MKRQIGFFSLVLLAFPTLARAAVDIPLECRVANRPTNSCGWSALETLARRHHISALYGLADKYTLARPKDLEQVVWTSEVKYQIQYRGNRGTAILQKAVRMDLGAIVGLRPKTEESNGHIVTLVDFGPKEVRFIDPNEPNRVASMDTNGFMNLWDGFALVLIQPEEGNSVSGLTKVSP